MTFDEICAEFEKTDPTMVPQRLEELGANILPELEAISGSVAGAIALFGAFVIGSVMADGKLAPQEYDMLQDSFSLFFGDAATIEECEALFKSAYANLDLLVEDFSELVAALSPDAQDDITLACFLMCAMDGKISDSEKEWIKKISG